MCKAAGDVLNAAGMKRHGQVEHFTPHAIMRLLFHLAQNGFVIAGMAAMAISFGALIVLLSIAPVSFAIPAIAAGFLLETVFAKIVLKEHVTWKAGWVQPWWRLGWRCCRRSLSHRPAWFRGTRRIRRLAVLVPNS